MIDLQAIEDRQKYDPPTVVIGHARADIAALIAEVRWLSAAHREDQTIVRHLEDELKRYRELAKVIKKIADCEAWDDLYSSDHMPKDKRHVVELLKETHDA